MTADELVAAVRVHVDRVHDAVRRLGCTPDAAVDVVHSSALELVDAVATEPEAVEDVVGEWFARARSVAGTVATHTDLPVGAGLLAGDDEQRHIAEALDRLPEQDRLALLLRDSYDLPEQSLATALGLHVDEAMARVAQARLRLLPLLGLTAPEVAAHPTDLGALARLGEPRPVAPRDARARRHAEVCEDCSDVLEAQSRARRRLAGLSVIALPDAARAAVLADVDVRAGELLPGVAPLRRTDGPRAQPRGRRLSPLVAALSLVLAGLVGAAAGRALPEPDEQTRPVSADAALPPGVEFASPPPSPAAPPSPPTVPEQRPRTSVFVVPPSPLPTPSPTPSPSPSPTPSRAAPTLVLTPASGADGTALTVVGVGFAPGQQVRVAYLDTAGEPTGSQALAAVDGDGRFSAGLIAQDPADEPGPHEVVATSGDLTARAVFTVEE